MAFPRPKKCLPMHPNHKLYGRITSSVFVALFKKEICKKLNPAQISHYVGINPFIIPF